LKNRKKNKNCEKEEMLFKIEQSNQRITGSSGIAIIGEIIRGTEICERLDLTKLGVIKDPDYTNGEIMKTYIGILSEGKSEYEYIETYRGDEVFSTSLGMKEVPSSETVRQRFDMAPSKEWEEILTEESLKLLKKWEVELTPSIREIVPLDIDVSPFDNSKTKKAGVSRTYKGFDGYSPIFGYIGKNEGYFIAVELREGKSHSQCDGGEFIRKAIRNAKQVTNKDLLLRVDSGHDSIDTIKICQEEGVEYLIKRNLRKEGKEKYVEIAKKDEKVKVTKPREGKTVYRGSQKINKGLKWEVNMIYEVIERTIDKKGEQLLISEIEVNSYWTSLEDEADTVIRLYEEHATSEQFHSEIKGDLDIERFPSGKFETNGIILHIAQFVYNMLRYIGQRSLQSGLYPIKKERTRIRIGTVIKNIIYIASKLVFHSNVLKLVFGKHSPYFPVYKYLYSMIV